MSVTAKPNCFRTCYGNSSFFFMELWVKRRSGSDVVNLTESRSGVSAQGNWPGPYRARSAAFVSANGAMNRRDIMRVQLL